MPKAKKTGLAAFTDSQISAAHDSDTLADVRTKAKGEIVRLSLRLTQDQWKRVHDLALNEGVSINQLTVHALSKLFQEKGLPGI